MNEKKALTEGEDRLVNTEYGQGRRIIELGEFVLVSKQPVISPSKQGNVLDLPTPVPPNTANPHESGPSRGPVTITQPKSPRARNEIPIFLPRQPSNDPVPSQSHLLPSSPLNHLRRLQNLLKKVSRKWKLLTSLKNLLNHLTQSVLVETLLRRSIEEGNEMLPVDFELSWIDPIKDYLRE